MLQTDLFTQVKEAKLKSNQNLIEEEKVQNGQYVNGNLEPRLKGY